MKKNKFVLWAVVNKEDSTLRKAGRTHYSFICISKTREEAYLLKNMDEKVVRLDVEGSVKKWS